MNINARKMNIDSSIIKRGEMRDSIALIIDALMIFGPCLGYILQAEKFKSIHSSKGFSLYVCLVILISNILRIFFWIGKRFTTILLAQSFVVLASQLYLIKVALDNKESIMTVKSKLNLSPLNDKLNEKASLLSVIYRNSKSLYKTLFSFETFWKWEQFSLFVLMTLIGTIAIGFICLFFGFHNAPFIELIGCISTGIEVILAVPQIVCNYNNKSTETLSGWMIFMWFIGDAFKLIYYTVMKSPIQFIACSIIQIVFDVILVSQIVYYCSKKDSNKEPNGFFFEDIQKSDESYGTFAYLSDDEEIKIKKYPDDDDVLIKDY